MAAAAEFPRGLTLSSVQQGSTAASVTFPAAVGIGWVLTAIDAIVDNDSNVAAGYGIAVTSSAITGVVVTDDPGGSGGRTTGEWTWSGQIAFPLGVALGITFSGATGSAVINQYLIVTAFPV